MLIENTLFGVRDKVKIAIERLRFYEPEDGYYLAYSGGKDSDVILELAKQAGVRFDAHHSLTTIDPPELVYHVRQHPEVQIDHPEKPFLSVLAKKGFPQRHRKWCCEMYKERGGAGRLVLTGVRAEESWSRRQRNMVEHCLRDPSKRYLHPIFDWTTEDVWQFIREKQLPYCCLYDEGWKRIGCLFCSMAGKQRLVQVERYPRYVKAFIKAFQKLHAVGRESTKRWKDGEEMFWWWLIADRKSAEKDQIVMFED